MQSVANLKINRNFIVRIDNQGSQCDADKSAAIERQSNIQTPLIHSSSHYVSSIQQAEIVLYEMDACTGNSTNKKAYLGPER